MYSPLYIHSKEYIYPLQAVILVRICVRNKWIFTFLLYSGQYFVLYTKIFNFFDFLVNLSFLYGQN